MENTLYDKSLEHDACGMGFVANINGEESHQLVEYGLQMLTRMNHRGGTGAEPDSGDGAGVLLSMPHTFFSEVAKEKNVELGERGHYAVGMFFLPKEAEARRVVLNRLIQFFESAQFPPLFTRNVPFQFENCGPSAQKSMPSFVQIAIKRRKSDIDFEEVLYQLRREIERNFTNGEVYVASLSSKTILYKGMLHAFQVRLFFDDLTHPLMKAKICLTHSRFSTNTFPSWDRAQPFRYLAHNGEINTLKGAENWMHANGIEVYNEENSDSAKLENCMEYMARNGRSIQESLMMMIPESFEEKSGLSSEAKAFYEYATSFVAPWDGPAGLVYTDGDLVGAALDRNGLRPSRYSITKNGFIVVSSESGVIDFQPSEVVKKGVLGPGYTLMIDTVNKEIIHNDALKKEVFSKHPYEEWLKQSFLALDQMEAADVEEVEDVEAMLRYSGYTDEVVRQVILPMAEKGEEPVIAMGYDSPLSILSDQPQSLFTYFKQQFAQVTNPPIDALREELVIGTEVYLGRNDHLDGNKESNCRKIKLDSPVLSTTEFAKLRSHESAHHLAQEFSTVYKNEEMTLREAIEFLFQNVKAAVQDGCDIIVLSDREMKAGRQYIPILLATSAITQIMLKAGLGNQYSLVIDSSEVSEVHHFATLLGYGASAVHPYGAYAVVKRFGQTEIDAKLATLKKSFIKGIVKVMSRIGISTISGYISAQLFEIVGIHEEVVNTYFTGTLSRISGIGLIEIQKEVERFVELAYGKNKKDPLRSGGNFQVKSDGEYHLFNQQTIYNFQKAIRSGNYTLYKKYSKALEDEVTERPTTLRNILEFKSDRQAIELSEVEPVERILKRFKVGAMSFGSLSQEAHECIAEAMNRLGGKSNSGEGGENRARFGTIKNSRIKQVASGRFGVNAEYLMSADELQIKMAQGAKPGEGGQLPGEKVFPWVAEIRGSTPGVRLISPPPHHDIYSIEDLAQLIFDLKQINPYAKINVKLVSSTGVGTVATGCVKAGANTVVISGFDGGTGASPRVSVRDAGMPLEIGLAEAH
ncbi:MAG: glutamate synthase large subunit, partial [Streptococcaceae bacterium]|nr:glutamate synthase large subunit [Streptococcaceae bacterium]